MSYIICALKLDKWPVGRVIGDDKATHFRKLKAAFSMKHKRSWHYWVENVPCMLGPIIEGSFDSNHPR